MRFHTSREKHGIRWWWGHTKGEFYWWPIQFLNVGASRNDTGLHCHCRILMLSLFLGWERFNKWNGGREFSFGVADWTIRLVLRGREHEWISKDPWWVRGVSLDLKDAMLGRMRYSESVTAENVPCVIPMPEGNYKGTATVKQATRKRSRWFGRTTTEVWIDIPNGGIPHSGKGESSWDCGDDGLCGIGGSSVADAVARAQASVARSRNRYGQPSNESIVHARQSGVLGSL